MIFERLAGYLRPLTAYKADSGYSSPWCRSFDRRGFRFRTDRWQSGTV